MATKTSSKSPRVYKTKGGYYKAQGTDVRGSSKTDVQAQLSGKKSSSTKSPYSSSAVSSKKSTLDIITDPVTMKQFSRDTAIAGSTYQPYTDNSENDRAEATGYFGDGTPMRNYEQTNPDGYYGTPDNRFPNTPENPRSPTVFSNASIIEDTIPRLVSQANALPTFGAPDNAAGGGGGEAEYSFDEILGFTDGKKKKKKIDYSGYEGREGFNFPRGYWETQYGDNAQVMKTLAEMQKTSDRYTRDSINDIKSKFAQREAAQEASNLQNLAGVKQALNLAGSSRYAPISSTGIISAQEQAGIKALTDIDTLERQAINEARQAQSTNDYKLLEQKLGVLDGIRAEKAAAMTSLQEAQAQSDKDNQIADLVSQGIVDPVEMLQTLNERGGNFTLAEITGSLKGLNDLAGSTGGGSFKFEAKQLGPLLGAGFSMDDVKDMQYDLNNGVGIEEILTQVPPEQHEAVKAALGVNEAAGPMTPGVGAPDELTERSIRSNLEPKIMAIVNKGSVSNEDRNYVKGEIAYYRDMGLSGQQILDIFSGWGQGVDTPYNNSLRDIIIANDKDGTGTSPTLSRVGTLLSNGNYKGAVKAVEQTAMLRAKELDPDGYMGDAPTEVYTKRIDDIKKLLTDNSDYGDTGFIEGNFNKVLGKVKGQRATEVRAKLKQLYQGFRKENSGVAVTPSEEKYLNDLFADLDDPKGNFITKLDVFQQGIIDRYNATRNSVSLPPVRVLEVLDPVERLNLYGSSTARSTDSNDAGI